MASTEKFTKITLLVPHAPDYGPPETWAWHELLDQDVVVLGAETLGRDELPADPTVGVPPVGDVVRAQHDLVIRLDSDADDAEAGR